MAELHEPPSSHARLRAVGRPGRRQWLCTGGQLRGCRASGTTQGVPHALHEREQDEELGKQEAWHMAVSAGASAGAVLVASGPAQPLLWLQRGGWGCVGVCVSSPSAWKAAVLCTWRGLTHESWAREPARGQSHSWPVRAAVPNLVALGTGAPVRI